MKTPRSRGSQLYLLQLLCVAIGLVLAVIGEWRAGVLVVGATFIVGALGRSVVPADHTGMLRVRSKTFDMVWMTTLGVSLIILAVIIPNQTA